MRIPLLIAAVLGILATAVLSPANGPLTHALMPVVSAQAPPTVPPGEPLPAQPSAIAVEAEEARTGWGSTAVWIAIGMVALVLLAVAVILSTRGGGRTVLKE